MNNYHLAAYDFLVVGALDCRMVSTTSVESPMESLLGGRPGPKTMDGLVSMELLIVVVPRPGELSLELPGAEQSGERHTDEASATSAPWHPAPVELDESKRTRGDIVRSLETQQVYLCSFKFLPNLLHHLGVEHPFPGPQPLSQQDICSLIEVPRDENCLQGEQFPLGPQEDPPRQPVQGA